MPVVAALAAGAGATQALRRSLPPRSPWSVTACRTVEQLEALFQGRLVEAVLFSPATTPLADLARLREGFPQVPWVASAAFRPDDAPLLRELGSVGVRLVLVDGVDNAVAGELVVRHSAAAERERARGDAARVLRLTERLQQDVWRALLARVDQPVRTAEIARSLGCSREHLSRQFGAGGAPNLKRVIDLTRVACAAGLLQNPGYDVATVARILQFATASHLSATARRIAGVASRGLAGLGPRGVLASFARGKTRSRF